jgi:hypothetical protein
MKETEWPALKFDGFRCMKYLNSILLHICVKAGIFLGALLAAAKRYGGAGKGLKIITRGAAPG